MNDGRNDNVASNIDMMTHIDAGACGRSAECEIKKQSPLKSVELSRMRLRYEFQPRLEKQ
jgi:hypothetical protein